LEVRLEFKLVMRAAPNNELDVEDDKCKIESDREETPDKFEREVKSDASDIESKFLSPK